MTAECLIHNQEILIDYVFGSLTLDLDQEIEALVQESNLLGDIIDSLYYLSIFVDKDRESLSNRLKSLDQAIATKLV